MGGCCVTGGMSCRATAAGSEETAGSGKENLIILVNSIKLSFPYTILYTIAECEALTDVVMSL